ncbi:MAG: hypothetical protein ACK4SA_07185 [Caldilinea sp.]
MADFVSLTCPACNGKLQIGKDLDRFAGGYCGTEFVVNRGGVVSLSPVVEGLKRVEKGVDKTASELAIARLNKSKVLSSNGILLTQKIIWDSISGV